MYYAEIYSLNPIKYQIHAYFYRAPLHTIFSVKIITLFPSIHYLLRLRLQNMTTAFIRQWFVISGLILFFLSLLGTLFISLPIMSSVGYAETKRSLFEEHCTVQNCQQASPIAVDVFLYCPKFNRTQHQRLASSSGCTKYETSGVRIVMWSNIDRTIYINPKDVLLSNMLSIMFGICLILLYGLSFFCCCGLPIKNEPRTIIADWPSPHAQL